MATATAKSAKATPAPRITGSGLRQLVAGGPTVRAFWVSSRSFPGMEHTVFLYGDGRLSCDCPGAYYRANHCAHTRVVAARLAEEAQEVARKQAEAEAEAACGWTLTAKGRRALEAWRAARETATTNPVTYPRPGKPSRPVAPDVRARVLTRDDHQRDTAILRPSHGNKPFSLMA